MMSPLLDGGAAAQPGVATEVPSGVATEVPSGDVDGAEMTPIDGRSKAAKALKVMASDDVRKLARAFGVVEAAKVLKVLPKQDVMKLGAALGVVVYTRDKTTRKVHWRKKVDILEDCRRALAEKHSEVPSGDAETQKHVDGTEMTADADVKVMASDAVRKLARALGVVR